MEHYDLVIIGAGPAGLHAAAECGAAGLKTAVFESNKHAGKKLLISGQGKCNLTNSQHVSEFINRYGSRARFVRKCLYAFSNTDLISYFTESGLKLTERSDGKIFPQSGDASDVLKHLLMLCRKADVSFNFNRKISSVNFEDGCFNIYCNNSTAARSDKLLIAAGGFTYPTTGSDGSGFSLAESLGHRIVTPKPSLTGVIADDADFRLFSACAGITVDCDINLYRNNSKSYGYSGRLLFTHKGLSGPVIIDNSRDFKSADDLRLNLFPGMSFETVSEGFISYCRTNGKSKIGRFFTAAGIPERLVNIVFKRSGAAAAPESGASAVSAADRKLLINSFTSLSFHTASLEGRKKAMCTAGGVDTAGLNPATMESRIIKGLFFAGEVIDIDGDSGGFNLQFAFSSAHAASTALKEYSKV